MAPAQGRSNSRIDGYATGTAPLVGPSKLREASSSQQNTSRPRATPTPTEAQTSDARNNDETQCFEPMPYNSWDGIILDEPDFPLSEIVALKRCNFSVHFYVYARLNGRTGVIARDLIMDILEKCSPMPDTEPEPEPQPDQGEPKIERKQSKGRGKAKEGGNRQTATAAPQTDAQADAATNIDQAVELEIPCQTFEQVCKDLSKCIQGMDMTGSTRSERQQTEACLETIRAVSDSAKELARRSLTQLAVAAAAGSSSPTPSAIDPNTHCVVSGPGPWNGDPCGLRLPCMAHSNRTEDLKKKPSGRPAPKVLSESNPAEALLSFQRRDSDARLQRRPTLVSLVKCRRKSQNCMISRSSTRRLAVRVPRAMTRGSCRTRRRRRRRHCITRTPVRIRSPRRRSIGTKMAPSAQKGNWSAYGQTLTTQRVVQIRALSDSTSIGAILYSHVSSFEILHRLASPASTD